jgi:F0F1-type ATP synthase assembly protein I
MADQERHQRRGRPGSSPGLSGAGSAGSFAGLGIQLAISILLFLYLGQWLDKKLGTEPLLLILGVFIGAALGIYNMYHALTAAQKKAREERGREK